MEIKKDLKETNASYFVKIRPLMDGNQDIETPEGDYKMELKSDHCWMEIMKLRIWALIF